MTYDQTYQPQAQPQGAPVVNVSSPNGNREKVVVTIKAGGPSDPWVVFHADSNAEAADLIGAAEATGLFALVAKGAEALKSHFLVGQQLGATPVQAPAAAEQQYYQQGPPQGAQQGYQQPPPQQQQQAPQGQQPPGPAPTCPHGTKIYKPSGVSNTGKAYGATWNCPLKVANWKDPNGCPTQWINNR